MLNYEAFFNECEVIHIKNEEHWHQLRATGIGGSDVGVLINESKYKIPFQLYQEKVGEVKPEFITNDAIEKGNRLEQPLVDVFKALYPQYQLIDTKDISLKSKEYAFMNANLDGALIALDGRKGVLEIKSTTIQNMKMLEQWKKDTIPISYYCQCLHYLATTKFDFCILYAILDFPWKGDLGQQETRVVIINREDVQEDIDLITTNEKEFWGRIEEKDPPPFLSRKINI